ncbi:NAD-dependent epimerase/dehydratase family protein [Synergistaceae bacterium OttesenSCG-928-D05]|nr:NAD-dependent epimerase/dehydratase family protein [Synergistaceae bacterium OttesenSCG-928-D05]
MRILVLGGTGAIGTFLVEKLISEGHEVFVTSRVQRDYVGKSTNKTVYILGDAHCNIFLNNLLEDSWDAIVDFMVYGEEEFKNRYDILLKNTKQYVFLSSSRIYANSDSPITENSDRLLDICSDINYLKTSEYALLKARQEDLLLSSQYKNWTVIRPYITYSEERLQLGGYEKEHWLYRALDNRTIVFSSNIAKSITTMTYGYDVANCIAMLIGNKKAYTQMIQITGSQNMTWGSILEIYLDAIEKKTGIRPKVCMIDDESILEKIMGNRFQIHYDRMYNRIFDSKKLCDICDREIEYTSMESGLGQCLRSFIDSERNFKEISWAIEGCLDQMTGETTLLQNIPSFRQKIKYLIARYMPLRLLIIINIFIKKSAS